MDCPAVSEDGVSGARTLSAAPARASRVRFRPAFSPASAGLAGSAPVDLLSSPD